MYSQRSVEERALQPHRFSEGGGYALACSGVGRFDGVELVA